MALKGIKLSVEQRAKLSVAHTIHSPETRAKIAAAHVGRTHTEETRVKIGMSSKGRIPTAEARAKMTCHVRIRRIRGRPTLCERCGTTQAKRFEWANWSGNYADPDDYIRLCRPCHRKLDQKCPVKRAILAGVG